MQKLKIMNRRYGIPEPIWLLKEENKMPGKLIVIEGTDSSGKETQAKKLIERLTMEGIPCETMVFPRYQTPTGRIVGQCYLGKKNLGKGDTAWFGDADSLNPEIASLYYAADRMAAKEEILEIINSGTHLVLDRYVESNMAHQGGKEENSEKENPEENQQKKQL